MPKGKTQPTASARTSAAQRMDWQQVVLNGGPPCFYLETVEMRFCGRAERWHDGPRGHEFVSLADLLATVRAEGRAEGEQAGREAERREAVAYIRTHHPAYVSRQGSAGMQMRPETDGGKVQQGYADAIERGAHHAKG